MSDYKYVIFLIASELAEQKYEKDFYELSDLNTCLNNCVQATARECAKLICETCRAGKSYGRMMNSFPVIAEDGLWRHMPEGPGGSECCDAEAIYTHYPDAAKAEPVATRTAREE